MEKKKEIPFGFMIIALILGIALYKAFDFENLSFEKPALAIVYIIGFLLSIIFIIKDFRNPQGNKTKKNED